MKTLVFFCVQIKWSKSLFVEKKITNFSKKISLAQGVTSEEGAQIGARKHNFIDTPEDSLLPVIQQVDTEELIKQAVDEAIEQEFSDDDRDNSPVQLDT